MTVLLHWLLNNGIGQNVTASIVLGVPTIALGWRKHKQHLQRLHDRLAARHEAQHARQMKRLDEIHAAIRAVAAQGPGEA